MILEEVWEVIKEKLPLLDIAVTIDDRNIITLRGECPSWDAVVEAGHLAAADSRVKNVVNALTVTGMTVPKKDYAPSYEKGIASGVIREADVLIVGAGISGCGIARALSKYKLDVIVAEMGDDVANGATKANNGDIHPGHDVKPGTLKAKLNVEGNRMYTKWAEELGFEFQRCGCLIAISEEADREVLEFGLKIAKLNGVDGAVLVDGERALEIEPKLKNAAAKPVAAMWLPSFGIVEPYRVAVALAENAVANGVKFMFDCTVAGVHRENGAVTGAVTSKGIIKAKTIINCAGLYADEISEMAGDQSYTLHNRKGTLAIMDKKAHPMYDVISGVFSLRGALSKKADSNSKGGGMCRTPEWNILLGPSATEVPDKEDTATTREDLEYAMSRNQNPDVGTADIIRMFAGARPADYKEDFVIEMSPVTRGFINCGAIQSPGMASAPAIAKMVEEIVAEDFAERGEKLQRDEAYNPIRKRNPEFRHLTREQQDALIKKDPRYGRIVCRCESITEGEILDAIHSPVVPTSVDAIKRRTRAGMGRCQGGFCQPRVIELLARELGRDWTEINFGNSGTNILIEQTRPLPNPAERGESK